MFNTTLTEGYIIFDTSDDRGAALQSGAYVFRYDWCTNPRVASEASTFEVSKVSPDGMVFMDDGEFQTVNMNLVGDRTAREVFARWLDARKEGSK